ncbi:MAG: right-handed parallel beta-helix repeat-containing protein, partial [Candidatus Thermoplasmatota archaeon]|nr:right-handed parallel beta-helix repeat-containing protein [Candidatus Thermoplasmatota archaeon]
MKQSLQAPLAMGSMIVIIAILSLGAYGDTGEDWVISDHVILEDEDMLLEGDIKVVRGGWLDMRGTTLTFNNTRPGEHTLQVLEDGRLTTSRSASGADNEIRSSHPLNPTRLYANWASGISLEHLRMENTGYIINGTPNVHNDAVLIANTDGVIIRDSEFLDFIGTLNLNACRRVTIEGCRVENPKGRAIYLKSSSEVVIEDNTIVVMKTGISISMSADVVIKDNIVEGLTGISIRVSYDVTVTGNQILLGRYGCSLYFSKLTLLEGNTFKGVLTYYSTNTGTKLESSSFVTVRQDSYENLTSAIEVWNFERFGIAYNHISRVDVSNCTVGIHIASGYNTVSNVTITGADIGILIDDEYLSSKAEPTGNTVIGSLIEDCTMGMSIVNSKETTLRSNTFRSNIDDILTRASWGVLEENGSHSGWEGAAIAAYGGDLRVVSTIFSDGGCAIVQGRGIAEGSTVTIEQSVLVDVSTTVVSTNGSRLVLINSTHPRVYDDDTNSSVEVYWDVEVSVRRASEPGRRLSGSLEVSDIEL